MAEEQKPAEPKQKTNAMLFIVLGCALIVIAMITDGPMQWLIFAFAIGALLYATFLSNRKTGQQ